MSIAAELLFVATISHADDEGRIEWSASQFRNRVFLGRAKAAEIEVWMAELTDSGLVAAYSFGDRTYAYLPAWHKHQTTNRPAESKIPDPPGVPKRYVRTGKIINDTWERRSPQIVGSAVKDEKPAGSDEKPAGIFVQEKPAGDNDKPAGEVEKPATPHGGPDGISLDSVSTGRESQETRPIRSKESSSNSSSNTSAIALDAREDDLALDGAVPASAQRSDEMLFGEWMFAQGLAAGVIPKVWTSSLKGPHGYAYEYRKESKALLDEYGRDECERRAKNLIARKARTDERLWLAVTPKTLFERWDWFDTADPPGARGRKHDREDYSGGTDYVGLAEGKAVKITC